MLPFGKNRKLQERVEYVAQFPGPAVRASGGLITCVSNANMLDTDFMTIDSGIGKPVIYHYDKAGDGVTAGHVVWAVAGGAGAAADAAATLRTAILANQKELTVVDNLDGTLTVGHRWPGAAGNTLMTETVANAGFLVANTTGGTDDDQITATTNVKLGTFDTDFDIDAIEITCPKGLTQDAANYFALAVKKGATVMASWSTLTGAQGSLTANTPKSMVLSVVAGATRAVPGDVLSLDATLTGTQTLPACKIHIIGRRRSDR